MKKYIFITGTLLLLFFSVKVSAEDIYHTATIYNTNQSEPVCVWVGHEPTNPIDLSAGFEGWTDIIFDGVWEEGYAKVNDNYLISGFQGTCSSNINPDGTFIDEAKVIDTSGSINGFLDYMIINFNGSEFDIQVNYLNFDPAETFPAEVELYTEYFNSSAVETMCFYLNEDTFNSYEVLPNEYGGSFVYVMGEQNGGGWVTNHNDTVTVNAFTGPCSFNINDVGVIDQAKVITEDATFNGLVNMISVQFDGSKLEVDVIYQSDYHEYHDEYIEPASVPAAIAISTVTTVASVGVASAIASGTASTVASTTTSTITSTATSAMNVPRLQKRFKDRYVKGYKLHIKTSFEKGVKVGEEFILDASILRKYSGGKFGIDDELTKDLSALPISDMLQKISETRDEKGIHGTYKLIGATMEPVKIEFKIKVDKKVIIQHIEIPIL